MATPVTGSQRAKRRKLDKTSSELPLIETVNALPLEAFRKLYWPDGLDDEVRTAANGKVEQTTIRPGEDTEDVKTTSFGDRVSTSLQSSTRLSKDDSSACFELFEILNRDDYMASSMGWHPARKKAEMKLPDLKYYMLWRKARNKHPQVDATQSNDTTDRADTKTETHAGHEDLLGFISFMPTYEDGCEVIYIYEIHVAPALQGYGIGPKMIGIVEEVGRRIGVKKSMLTVFRRNGRARDVYERKMGWEVDEFSPADRKMRGGKVKQCDYVILSKRV